MSAAGEYPIVIQEGESFRLYYIWEIDGEPVDMTGWTGLCQVRKRPNTPLILEASTDPAFGQGTILLGDDGSVDISWSVELLDSLGFQTGAYDVVVTDTEGVPYRRLQGNVTYSRSITDEDES